MPGEQEDSEVVVQRLRTAHARLSAAIAMIEVGRDCREVVTQLAAVTQELDRAGYSLVASGIRQYAPPGEGATEAMTEEELDRLFLDLP